MPFNFRAHITLWTKGLDQNPSTLTSPIVAYFQLQWSCTATWNLIITITFVLSYLGPSQGADSNSSYLSSLDISSFIPSTFFFFSSYVLKSNSDSFCLFQISNLLGKSDGKRRIPNKIKKETIFQLWYPLFYCLLLLVTEILCHCYIICYWCEKGLEWVFLNLIL